MLATASRDLLWRSGDLKRELLEFAQGRRYRRDLQETLKLRLGKSDSDEAAVGNALDYFVLEVRLADGRTIVEHFVDAHPELPQAERDMLLGWRDVVEGVFEVEARSGEALIVLNLLDELTYRVRSNMGVKAFSAMASGSFIFTRLVPFGKEWLVSGFTRALPRSARAELYRVMADSAPTFRKCIFRNPAKLAQAWDMQRRQREAFIRFFGSDLVVFPGHQVADQFSAYLNFRSNEKSEDGKSPAERAEQMDGITPKAPRFDVPDDLKRAENVAVVYDEVDGIFFMDNFPLVDETFARPELARDGRHRKAVLSYLEEPTISPRALQRLAERDPERANLVWRQVLRQPSFSWERDGDALLRRHKAEYYAQPALPTVTPMSERLARARLEDQKGGAVLPINSKPGRNELCPCGSGRKYKRCCGG